MLINKTKFYSKYFIRTVACFLISALIFSCAQIVAPGGGAKDTTPPKVVKYIPDSAKLNFNSKNISIDFNEYITLKDLNNQLIVSPPLDKQPDIKVKNKTLLIDFDKDEKLKPNTTYCMSFGNAVQDINENNPIENFSYIFSTGNFIDSLTVKGKVQNAFDHKTEKGILVMLYSDLTDSVIYKNLPDYFAKTKEDGTFQINNIKEGNYKIVAIKDANANYKYDGSTENIGFNDTIVNPSEKQKISIDLFQEPEKKLFLKKTIYDSYGKIVFVFNRNADSVHIEPLDYSFKKEDVFLDYSANKDTITYWFRNIDKDVLKLQLRNENKIMDTLEYKLITKEEALKSKKHPLKFSLLNSFTGNQNFDLNALDNNFGLLFSAPISNIDDNKKISLNMDSSKISESITFQKTSNSTFLRITNFMKLKENTNYHLFVPPATFTDFFGLTNDTIKIDFKTREEKFYGSLKLKINVSEMQANYIVQLLDEKENIVRENAIQKPETLTYEYLYPKKYKLKIIVDENKNGKWDSGDYIKHLQPEKVIYNSELINVRSNWDLDLDWKVE